jgi:hypothetical protein
MAMKPFTSNFDDNSTDAGFQFTFHCDCCGDGYQTEFIESQTYRKGSLIRGITKGVSIGASLLGHYDLGWHVERGADIYNERFEGMSPEWHKEHEEAFVRAQNEAKEHFHRCPRCKHWVCDDDWNEEDSLCVECAPRLSVEMNAIRAEKMVQDIRDKAENTQVFSGKVERKQITCPNCGKTVNEGKFCNNCGAKIGDNACPGCGAKYTPGARFCAECGQKL